MGVVVTWLAFGMCAVLGGAILAYYAARGLEKLRALRRAGWAVVVVAVVACIHGGAKNLLPRFSADDGITVTAAEFTKSTNDVDVTTLTYSYAGTNDVYMPLWARQSVSNEWEHLSSEWMFDDRFYANGTNTVYWFVNPPVASNTVPYKMYWIGNNPPPVEIEESGGVEIVDFSMTSRRVAITYAVDGSVLRGKVGVVGIEMSQTNNVWLTLHSTNVTATVTNTFTRWGFYVDRLTRWRVRMEVEQ